MTFVNQIIDTIKNKPLWRSNNISIEDCRMVMEHEFLKNFKSSIYFDIGDLDRLNGFKSIKELSNLPFSRCVFDFTFINNKGMIVSNCVYINQGNSLTKIIIFQKFSTTNHWGLFGYSIADFYRFGKDSMEDFLNYNGNENYLNVEAEFIVAIERFLSAINCVNVKKVKKDPPIKLQKKRLKKGKLPLFSYYILELSGRDQKGKNLGGNHSSPRIHLRRGHPRQFSPGKWTWVQPCVVGNKKLGIILKDYKLGGNYK